MGGFTGGFVKAGGCGGREGGSTSCGCGLTFGGHRSMICGCGQAFGGRHCSQLHRSNPRPTPPPPLLPGLRCDLLLGLYFFFRAACGCQTPESQSPSESGPSGVTGVDQKVIRQRDRPHKNVKRRAQDRQRGEGGGGGL